MGSKVPKHVNLYVNKDAVEMSVKAFRHKTVNAKFQYFFSQSLPGVVLAAFVMSRIEWVEEVEGTPGP